jgi:integrase
MERNVTQQELAEKVTEFLMERKMDEHNTMNWGLGVFREKLLLSMDDIHTNSADIFELIVGLKEKYKPSSVNHIANSIKSFFNWMEERGYTEGNMLSKFPRGLIAIPKRDAVLFTEQNYSDMLDKSEGTEWNLLIKIGWNTGMRIGDCARLMWESVILEERTIALKPSKTSEFETKVEIPMSNELYEALLEKNGLRDGNKFVMGRLAIISMVGNGNISRHFKYFLDGAGLYKKGKTFHAFRRTAISRWLSHPNADIITVKHLSGHKNMKSLLRYIHPSLEKKKLIMGIE